MNNEETSYETKFSPSTALNKKDDPCTGQAPTLQIGNLPDLTYCYTVWHFCKASDARKLERVQERALHAVYDKKTAEYEELLSQAKLPSLVNGRLQDILTLMFKVKNKNKH